MQRIIIPIHTPHCLGTKHCRDSTLTSPFHSADLWSKIKSWFPNPHKSNHIRSLLVHEVASCPQTRDRFNVEITVARISLKSLPCEENWLQESTLPKP